MQLLSFDISFRILLKAWHNKGGGLRLSIEEVQIME